MESSLIHIIPSLAVFFNSLFLGILFIAVKAKNKKANLYLAVFLLLHCVNILNNFFGEFENLFEFNFVFEPILFVFPVLYFYLISTVNAPNKFWYYIFYLPGIILNLMINSRYVLSEKLIVNSEIIFYVIEMVIPIIAYRLLLNHNKNILNYYSEIENKTLSWIKNIFTINIIIHFLNLSTFAFDFSDFNTLEFIIDSTSIFLTVFMLFLIGYNGFTQPKIIFNNRLDTFNHNTSFIKQKASEDLIRFNNIKVQIQSDKIFLDQNINLNSLSLIFGLKEKKLSMLINKYEKTNFYFFINKFRVEEFKCHIKSSHHIKHTLKYLANESGFKNKSTFYSSFKRLEGQTPNQYIQNLKTLNNHE